MWNRKVLRGCRKGQISPIICHHAVQGVGVCAEFLFGIKETNQLCWQGSTRGVCTILPGPASWFPPTDSTAHLILKTCSNNKMYHCNCSSKPKGTGESFIAKLQQQAITTHRSLTCKALWLLSFYHSSAWKGTRGSTQLFTPRGIVFAGKFDSTIQSKGFGTLKEVNTRI